MVLKNTSGSSFLLILTLTLISSCYKHDHIVVFTSDEITRLISGDTTKSWETVKSVINGTENNGDPCAINTIRKFSFSKQDQTTHLYEIYKNPGVCNGIDTLVETGEWYVIQGSPSVGIPDTLAVVLDGDTLRSSIREITSIKLRLSGSVNNSQIEEDLEWYNP